METYLTADELRVIADLAEFLNDGKYGEISVSATLADANGEVVGFVRISEGGEYAYHGKSEEDE